MRPTWWASVPGMCFRILSLVVSAGVSTLLAVAEVAAAAPPAPAPVPAPPMPAPVPVPAAEPIPVLDPARAPAPPPVVMPVPAQKPNTVSRNTGQQPQNAKWVGEDRSHTKRTAAAPGEDSGHKSQGW